MDAGSKSKSRRQEIRKNRPDAVRPDWQQWKDRGVPQSAALAGAFFVLAALILLLRQDVVPYRVGQPVTHDVVSRVAFPFWDAGRYEGEQQRARQQEPRVYVRDDKVWPDLERDLLALPARMNVEDGQLPPELSAVFRDGAVRTELREAARRDGSTAGGAASREAAHPPTGRQKPPAPPAVGLTWSAYESAARDFVRRLADQRHPEYPPAPMVLLAPADRRDDGRSERTAIRVGQDPVPLAATYPVDDRKELPAIVRAAAEKAGFPPRLQPDLVEYTLARLRPTHLLDQAESAQRAGEAARAVPRQKGHRQIVHNEVLVGRTKSSLNEADVQLLRAENDAYVASLKGSGWRPILGTTAIAAIVTVVLGAYCVAFQPRVVKNHARGAAIVALLAAMLLPAALAGTGNGPIYLFGLAPTLLVAMILSIAYDRRFAIGVASLHGLLVTIALNQSPAFFLVLWVGVLTAGLLLDDVRTRSKLVEVGGAAALAMMASAGAAGLLAMDGLRFVVENALYAGAAGLAAGFVVLGILPFIERAFRITTSMTLLELADPSQPLLRRLQIEAPGTYNHSFTVAILAEAAAEAIGADALLCRVASYYHDVGKINKPDYFVENQQDGHNRHLNLDPNLSLLIIVGHVKDGVELAREYHLPTGIVPFIQQHHGTTVVEYFYRRACTQQEQKDPTLPAVQECQFRYPGPRPRTKEVAIVMICDAVESATRALDDPSPAQIEGLVTDLTRRRMHDGQFDECDITMKDLDRIKRALIKALAGIYHGRIPYPSSPPATSPGNPPLTMETTVGQVRAG